MVSFDGQLPDRILTIDGVLMSAYAGATWDWIQTHLDTAAARAAGFERPIVDGQMLGALLAAHAQDGVGGSARLIAMSFRHKGPVYQGDRVRVRGVARRLDRAIVLVEQDIHVIDEDGQPPREVILGAITTVQLDGPAATFHEDGLDPTL